MKRLSRKKAKTIQTLENKLIETNYERVKATYKTN